MNQSLANLEWDSDFFNFNVGRVEGTLDTQSDLENVEKLIRNRNSRLSYYSSTKELPHLVNLSNELDFVLVDRKTTYIKTINPELVIGQNISTIDRDTPDEKLKGLAIQSGIFSRFNVDQRIDRIKFEELYGLWMINSLNRKIAKEVLISTTDNAISGFVTIGEKNKRADIGIIAVDKAFRGNGIGKLLMTSAEKWFSNIGYKSIQVVTQGDNVPACKLYESCGYTVESIEYYYHIWEK